MPFLSMKSAQLENIRCLKVSSNYFRESKPMLSDSLNGQRWIFLKKGLDDFRDGFPPSSDNVMVYGTKRTVPVTLRNNALKSSCAAKQKGRKKSRTQVCLSKLSPLQQARREYVVQLFEEVFGVLYPEVLLRVKAGYNGYEKKRQMLQEFWEDKQTQATSPQTQELRVSQSQDACTWFSKKKASAREKVAELNSFALLDEHIKRTTKHFCDWVITLGGGNCSIDEGALMNLFSTSCGNKPAFPGPFHVVQLGDMQAGQSKGREILLPQAVGRSSRTRHQPWPFKEVETMKSCSAHAFKEFLERKGYRKPQFLLKMLSEEDDGEGHEEAPKSCK
ncbi:protein FAM47A isoform X2 [Nothoprocta perdicaria]|uniref:protein FAM47A isoform X2 n=1 Tax=Nothoprocta perdicaria TaxID=30464 RepID=UPI000E1BF65C|nr:protein FAM47A isoform X2 [Nothoprocta perdicaria]